jgi:TolB-like protein/DNA-binding winged helix-turn-helix (wHTH) protein/thioredoxin-like negative regulator of GroEL
MAESAIGSRPSTASRYRLEELLIDVGRRQVWRGDTEIPLPGLSFDLLLELVRSCPNLVTYDQLMASVWPGLVVSPETVTQRVKLVRDALGDDARSPRYVSGIRGRGYRVIGRVEALPDPSESPSLRSKLWHPRHMAMAAAGLVFVLVVIGWLASRRYASDESGEAAIPAQTIAVLPFENLSGDPANDYLGDGLSEDLTDRLANVPGLRVSARVSSLYFKDRQETAQAIGRLLGVRHLVEGSVRKSGNSLRVTAQLIDTASGYHLWSGRFDRPFSDVLAIQEEISLAILEDLDVQVIDKARALVMQGATTSPEALDLYLKARKLDQRWQPDTNERAIEYYERAIALDPAFAAAYLRLADAIASRGQASVEPPSAESNVTLIEPYIRKAIELDPDSADAHAFLARNLLTRFDMEGMRREMRAAEDLNPSSELALYHLTQLYAFVGWPPEKAIEYAEQWVRIDPLNPWAACNVAIAQGYAFKFDDALQTMDRLIERDPNFWVAHYVRTWPLLELGRSQDALASAKRAVELHPSPETRGDLALVYARMGDSEKAREVLNEIPDSRGTGQPDPLFEASIALAHGNLEVALSGVRRSYAEGNHFVVNLLVSPDMVPLHGRSEYQQVVRRLGLERRVAHTADYVRRRGK